MDDVTFGRNGRDAERWRLHSATAINDMAIPGCSLMPVNACLLFIWDMARLRVLMMMSCIHPDSGAGASHRSLVVASGRMI